MTYHVKVESEVDGVAAAQLWSRAATASVFNHPGWWQAATSAYGRSRPLTVLSVTQGGALVGLWPLWTKRLGAREGFARIIEPVGARVTDYIAPLIADGHDVGVLTELMVRRLAEAVDPLALVLLPKIADPGVARAVSATAHGRGFRLIHEQTRSCPTMPLMGSMKEQEARWRSNHRGEVRRRLRRIAEVGPTSLHVLTDPSAIESRLPQLFDAHISNWGTRSGGSEFEEAAPRRFLVELTRRLPPRLLHYSEVVSGSDIISLHFGFDTGCSLLWYKPAFHIAWQRYAPGKLHLALMTEWAIARGYREIDFMQGDEAYKLSWTETLRQTRSFALARALAYPVWAWNTKVRKLAAEYRV